MKKIIEVKKITKHFHYPEKITILDDVDFSLEEGTCACITGASGEGKTTFLQILGTLQKPDQGFLVIDQIPLTDKNETLVRQKKIGFIFQSYYLLEDLTSLENVLMPSIICNKKQDKEFGKYLLEMVGLFHRKDFYVKKLSGGERQRLCIARAFCNDPKIILADEPTGNLDHKNSEDIHNLLLNCVKKQKKSLIVVSHDPSFPSLCDQTYILNKAKIFLK